MAYLYRLEGYDTDWQPAYTGRAEYQDLPEGEYTFQVQAVDRDLNYSKPVTVTLSIVPDSRQEALAEAFKTTGQASEFVGESAALRQAQAHLAQVATTEETVLILGETGTGKGLAARNVHKLSKRNTGPFIQINCGAIPEGLVESELFGHEKGAFTGATHRKLGKVELAENGTLFLDEIGDLPMDAQVKLLRLLEEKSFERVGGTETLAAKVRVIAATNRDLERMVAEGTFRADLFYRLQGFDVPLPPLRQRPEDIRLLAIYFIERMAEHLHKPVTQLSDEALARLQQSDWPGNVRELEHAVRRAVVVCNDSVIGVEDLALSRPSDPGDPTETLILPEEYERRFILQLLEKTDWVVRGPNGAAALWGVPEATLRSRMKKHGLQRPPA
jgi:transcriptional regulator with GAF, ATPase, and Fis domain